MILILKYKTNDIRTTKNETTIEQKHNTTTENLKRR